MSPRPFPLSAVLAVALGLLTLAVYWPVTGNDFVNYDDDVYVQSNAQVQKGLTLENVAWAFTHTVSCNWHPVTMLSHMLDCQVYGLNPWGHHLTSLLLHAADAVLLFLLLRRLTGAIWLGAWVAAMFALHPLHVESVAWVAERKDVLSAFFGLLTLLFYVRYVRAPAPATGSREISFLRSRDYWFACLGLALGLMSKPMLVTWPFVMLLLDYWPLGRLQTCRIRSLVLEKVPFFILTAAASLVTLIVQKQEGATQTLSSLSPGVRVANATLSYGWYLLKMVWPADLSIYYPYPKLMVVSRLLVTVIILAGISAFCWSQRRRHPFLLMGWLWFVGTLVPVIGLVQVGSQAMADRYMYLPSVGVLILVAWGARELARRSAGWANFLSFVAVITVLLCIGPTRQAIALWKNSETLFRHAIKVTADNSIAQNNLASALNQQGRTNEAISGFREALRISPGYAAPHMNLGNLLAAQGFTNEGLAELQKAVQADPADFQARYSLGYQLLKFGQTDAAISQFKAAIDFRTNDPGSFKLLDSLLLKNGQTNAALSQLQDAVKLLPSNPAIRYELGNLLVNNAQTDDAIHQFQEAIRLKPDFFEAHNNLASLLSKQGKIDLAIGKLHESIRLKPDYADAHYNLGVLYLKKGLGDEAAGEFQMAIRLNPDFAPSHYYLGTILIRKGRLDAAISELQAAVHLDPAYAFAHNKLGIALGAAGHLTEAVAEFQEAIRLKPDYAEANTNLAIALKMQGAAAH